MKKFFVLVLAFSLVFGLSSQLMAQEPEQGGTLVYAHSDDADALDPHMTTSINAGDVIVNVFDGLVQFKPDSTEVEPALAKSWTTSDDELTWTFELREDVEFHDGTPFNAEAVVFDIERQIDSDHEYYMPGEFPYADFSLGMIEEVKAIDEYTVEFTLEDPYAPFLKNLAMFATKIVSPEAVKEYGDDIAKNPVGTGPFVFDEWVQDDHITIKANDDYWGGRPHLDEVIFQVIPSNDTRLMSLERGNIHVMDGINPTDLEKIRRNEDLELLEIPGLNIGYIALHNEKAPFDNKLVRKAMNYAINKEEICEHLMQGQSTPANGPVPPGIEPYDEDMEGYPYNPEKARELLAEAGYEDGFSFTLRTYSSARAYNPVGERLAVAVQEYLQEVGIKADIEQLEWNTYLEEGKAGEHTAAFFGWLTDNGDPDNFLNVFFHTDNQGSTNRAFYSNEEIDNKLEEAVQISEPEKRYELYEEILEVIVDDAPFVFLNYSNQQIGIKSNVKNAETILHPSGDKSFHDVWLDE